MNRTPFLKKSGFILSLIYLVFADLAVAQSIGNTYQGTISISGYCMGAGIYPQVNAQVPTQPKPEVEIHTTTGGTFTVSFVAITGTSGLPRWYAEQTAAQSGISIGANTSSTQQINWSGGLRSWVAGGTLWAPQTNTLPNVIWKVVLAKDSVEKDVAYIAHTVTGQMQASWYAYPGTPSDNIMEGSTWSAPKVHLYEGGAPSCGREGIPDQLKIDWKLLNEQVGPAKRVQLRVGGKIYEEANSSGTQPAVEQAYSRTISATQHGGESSLRNVKVELWVDGQPWGEAQTPECFSNSEFAVDFGLIKFLCRKCPQGDCIPGEQEAGMGSIDYTVDLGRVNPDGQTVQFALHDGSLDIDTAKAASFQFRGLRSSPVELIELAPQSRRQVSTPSGLVDLQDIKDGSNNYLYTEMKFYRGKGTKSGSFYPGTDWYKTLRYTYELAGDEITGTDRLTITETDVDSSKDTIYEYGRGDSKWTLLSHEGERKETRTTILDAPNNRKAVTIEVRDSEDALISKVEETYTTFAWGQQLTKRVVDPDGLVLTSEWTYENSVPALGYGCLIKWKDENGYWEKYSYDTEKRRTKTVRQHLDAADTATDAQSAVETISYSGKNYTVVGTLLGEEISRRYVTYTDHTTYEVERIEECVTAGAAAAASDSRVTQIRYESNGKIVTLPDGTLVLSASETLEGGGRRTTTDTGKADSEGTAVVEGLRRVVEMDAIGNITLQTTKDIVTDLLLESATTEDTDDFGRPTQIAYLDGTEELFTYGCCGLEVKIDRRGVETSYSYDAFDNIAAETRAGVTTTFEYDPLGRLRSSYRMGSDDSSVLIGGAEYNLAGQETEIHGPLGTIQVSYSKDSSGILTRSETLPDAATRILRVYPDGQALDVSGTSEFPIKYEYGVDEDDGPFVKTIRVGNAGAETEWTKAYRDLLSRPWKFEHADGAAATRYWNVKGQLVREVDPDGITQLYAYNDLGQLEYAALDANANGTIDFSGTDRIARQRTSYLEADDETWARETVSAWGVSGEVILGEADTAATALKTAQRSFGRESDAELTLGESGAFTINLSFNDGRTVESLFQDDRLTSRSVAGSGAENAGEVNYTYDPHGRLATEARAGDATITYTYNNADLLTSVTQDGVTTAFEYNNRGNRTQTVLPDEQETDYEYFPTGLLKKVSGDQAYPQDYTYDPQGRIKTLTMTGEGGTRVTTWNYHAQRGWLSSKRDAADKGPDYTYTAAGRLHTRALARSFVGNRLTSTYGYNAFGDLSTVTFNAGAANLAYAYDRRGRLTSIVRGGTETFGFTVDEAGRPVEETFSGGVMEGLQIEFGYDAFGRLNLVTPTAASSLNLNYAYDGASRMKSASTGDFEARYTYAATSSRIAQTQFRHSNSPKAVTERTYDVRGRLIEIATALASPTPPLSSTAYAYNDLDQRTRSTVEGGSYWDFGYDDLGQVTSGTKRNAANNVIPGRQFTYTYDASGNRTQTVTNDRTASYSSNLLNQTTDRQVPGAIDVSGEADPAAVVKVNDAVATRQIGYFHRAVPADNATDPVYLEIRTRAIKDDLTTEHIGFKYVPKTPESFTYDDDGNLLSDGRFNYTWDAHNRLTALESITGTSNEAKRRAEYLYDPFGRRIQKRVWMWNETSGGYALKENLRFLYRGWNLIAEVDEEGEIVRSHLWGLDLSNSLQGAGGAGGLLCTTSYSLETEQWFPAYDGNGNVTAMVNAASGAVQARFEYDPFGNPLRATGAALAHAKFRFSSTYSDIESDFQYYGYRFYNPETGRWLNRDPIGELGGMNLYGFVSNNAIGFTDVLGWDVYKGETILALTDKYKSIDRSIRKRAWAKLQLELHQNINPRSVEQRQRLICHTYELRKTIYEETESIERNQIDIDDFDRFDFDRNGIIDGVENDAYQHSVSSTEGFDPLFWWLSLRSGGIGLLNRSIPAKHSDFVIDGDVIRFDASRARLASAPSRGSGYGTSPETLATVDDYGQVVVFEGRHRVNLTLEGKTFAESVPGQPGWLEYDFKAGLPTNPGVPAGTWTPPLNKTPPLLNPSNPWDGLDGY